MCVCVWVFQRDQPGHALCYARLQDASQGQRKGGSGVQNAQRRASAPGKDAALSLLAQIVRLSVLALKSFLDPDLFSLCVSERRPPAGLSTLLDLRLSWQNLALCTASLMYILSRDRLNMDLDRSCLELMIRLLELDQDRGGAASIDCNLQFSAREIAKMKEKIRKLCDTVHNKHLDLENITVRRGDGSLRLLGFVSGGIRSCLTSTW